MLLFFKLILIMRISGILEIITRRFIFNKIVTFGPALILVLILNVFYKKTGFYSVIIGRRRKNEILELRSECSFNGNFNKILK